MQSWQRRFSCLAISGAIASYGNRSLAQITPDTTLGNESSQVTLTGEVDSINGGATRGFNLFHSFGEFNVGEGRAAIFNSPSGIENILTRVTGGNPSNILGMLGVAGNANLFLINPNGIVFGPNARLDIGSSFVGTTANAIAFGDRGFFSATNPENPSSLLSINPSALLFNQIHAASIENTSVAPSGLNPSFKFTATGLRVPDGKSLLLVGGDINMNSGGLFAFGGRVELGGLAGAGTVRLNGEGNNLSLSFPDGVERSNISLRNGAGAFVAAGDSGSIAVNTRNLEMTGESFLLAGIESGLGSDNSKAGNIDINATGAVNLDNGSFLANQVLAEARGQGGDVNISTRTLRVEGGAQLNTATSGNGGGNLNLNAIDVQLIGTSAKGQPVSGLFAIAQSNSTGDAGNLTINTNTLLVKDGAQVSDSTFGSGKGGNLTVTADKIQVIGTSANSQVSSGLFAQAGRTTGNAGDLTINTSELQIQDGAQVSGSTFGSGKGGNLTVTADKIQVIGTSIKNRPSRLTTDANEGTGDAGDLSIDTNELIIQDGAEVSSGTFDSGKGGNLTVTANKLLLFNSSPTDSRFSSLTVQNERGSAGDAGNLLIKTNELLVRDGSQISAATFGSGQSGNLTVTADKIQLIGTTADGKFPSGLAASSNLGATGNASNLTINTGELLIEDRAEITVSSLGEGVAGNLDITAKSVNLDNNGKITAQTRSGNGGNLKLDVGDLLLLRRGSEISTTAGTAQQGGDGGNIDINTDLLVAFPFENSDITANAFRGNGGRVNITSQGIFGIQSRAGETPESDITASSQFGVNGVVDINTPDIDPRRGLVSLPTVPVDTEVVQACTPGSSQANSKFVVTGRGGLPPTPNEALDTDAIAVDWVTLNPESENKYNSANFTSSTTLEPKPIVEAQGWIIDKNGKVVLTASIPTATPHNFWQKLANCSS